jgi:hypothetical protein
MTNSLRNADTLRECRIHLKQKFHLLGWMVHQHSEDTLPLKAACFLLIPCFSYPSVLKMVLMRPSEALPSYGKRHYPEIACLYSPL